MSPALYTTLEADHGLIKDEHVERTSNKLPLLTDPRLAPCVPASLAPSISTASTPKQRLPDCGASHWTDGLPTIEGPLMSCRPRWCSPWRADVSSSETRPLRLRERVSRRQHQSLRDCHTSTKPRLIGWMPKPHVDPVRCLATISQPSLLAAK